MGEFLPLPFTDHTCYEKGTREGQNGRKKLLFLEGKISYVLELCISLQYLIPRKIFERGG